MESIYATILLEEEEGDDNDDDSGNHVASASDDVIVDDDFTDNSNNGNKTSNLVDDTVSFMTTTTEPSTTTTSTLLTSSPLSNTNTLTTSNCCNFIIDNTKIVYHKITLPLSISSNSPFAINVTVYCTRDVLYTCPMILKTIQIDINQCLQVLPYSVHNLIRNTNIYINTTYQYSSSTSPTTHPHHPHDQPKQQQQQQTPYTLGHLTTHHDSGWLVHW